MIHKRLRSFRKRDYQKKRSEFSFIFVRCCCCCCCCVSISVACCSSSFDPRDRLLCFSPMATVFFLFFFFELHHSFFLASFFKLWCSCFVIVLAYWYISVMSFCSFGYVRFLLSLFSGFFFSSVSCDVFWRKAEREKKKKMDVNLKNVSRIVFSLLSSFRYFPPVRIWQTCLNFNETLSSRAELRDA